MCAYVFFVISCERYVSIYMHECIANILWTIAHSSLVNLQVFFLQCTVLELERILSFTIRISVHNNCWVPGKLLLQIHDVFALKYKVWPHLFAVIKYNRCLYKQHWCFYRLFCTLQAKKAGNKEQDTTYQMLFYCNLDFMYLVFVYAQTC